ncbi:ABC transporter permease [Actinomadura barringtoniae]|uniref:ABC transporter permease n=1 Tax=Actinomadura barringtoniae TaxID=1427535 RepID=A0A939PHK6_9ACTN|nr:ABC transporter permease [Actinomadura barringtoniae]MBO2453012.1 ABC transporter permease [Actinomadura barringtoniae]
MPVWGMLLSAFAEIRTSKVRVGLSLVCVSAMVAVVTLAIALGGLAQQAVVQTFEQEVGRPVTLDMQVPDNNGNSAISTDTMAQIQRDLHRYHVVGSPLRRVEQLPVRQVLPGGTRPIKGNPETGEPLVTVGTNPVLDKIRRLHVGAGRWFDPTDDHRFEPQLVVGENVAKQLGPKPLGAVVELAGPRSWIRGRVVGVFSKSTPWAPSEIYMPYSAMVRWNIGPGNTSLIVRVPKADAKRITKRLKDDAARSWGLGNTQIMAQEGDTSFISGTFGKVLVAVAVFLLLLGSLPVLVLGLMAVRQRRSELGVQRCFGATGPDLFLGVLLEGLIVSCAGGLLGIAGVYAISGPLFDVLSHRGPFGEADLHSSFPWRAALLGMGVAVSVGLFTGLIPALRAMRRSVIQAIRS